MNPCTGGCSEQMEEIWQGFQQTHHPLKLKPAIYSGNCFFKSRDYRPGDAHRSIIVVDHHPNEDRFFFASGFRFFGPPDGYSDVTLEEIRKRVQSGGWKNFGNITEANETSRVVLRDIKGNPAWIYFMRQEPLTEVIYYITYWSVTQISFCEMHPNEN